jgi:hypothetical protein
VGALAVTGQSTAESTVYHLQNQELSARPAFAGGSFAEATSRNNRGHVAGSCLLADGQIAAAWRGGPGQALGQLGGGFSQVLGLNDFGALVGTSLLPPTASAPQNLGTGPNQMVAATTPAYFNEYERAFIIASGRFRNLNDAYPRTGWIYLAATAVGNAGDIVGTMLSAGKIRGFVITPTTSIIPAVYGAFNRTPAVYAAGEPVGLEVFTNVRGYEVRVNAGGLIGDTLDEIPYQVSLHGLPAGTHAVDIQLRDAQRRIRATWKGSVQVQ